MAASGPPAAPRGRQVRNPLSLTRVDSAIARSAAGFGVAFLLQSVGTLLAQQSQMNLVWFVLSTGGIVAALLFSGVASIVRRGVRIASVTFAAVYLLVLVTWPFAVIDQAHGPAASPWIYYLMTIATAMAAIGLDIRIATIYLAVIPLIYLGIRLTPAGGDSTLIRAVLDSLYALILGGVITIITYILRQAATSVDRAQEAALERYSHAVRQHAIEVERVQVDSIVHDSVLTTLLSAARAYIPEAKELAATMAGNAIGYLREAVAVVPDSDVTVRGDVLATRISEAASTMSQPFTVRTLGVSRAVIPLAVSEAIYSAAVQAMVNSLQHAGSGVARWVEVNGIAEGGLEVEIGDNGAGFDTSEIPTERLGVRVSILERLSSAGGHAEIESSPGRGTRVRLRWPSGTSAPRDDEFNALGETEDAT